MCANPTPSAPAPPTSLHPYMVFAGDPADGALPVFASTAADARKLGWPEIAAWCDDAGWIDIRANRLRKHVEHLRSLAQSPEPHFLHPEICRSCETWGAPPTPDGRRCLFCADA